MTSRNKGGLPWRLIALLAIGAAACAVVTLVAQIGGPGRSIRPALDQISRTREARVRQLQLEREEGDAYDTAAQERSDGEDEQQGGIESVHWGPGWGPSMDKAFGSQVVDQSALDAFKPIQGKALSGLGEFDRDIADDQAKASTYEKEVMNLNREADADERAAEQEQSRVAPQHRRKLGTTKAVRKAAARSARKVENSVQPKRASQGKLRRFPFAPLSFLPRNPGKAIRLRTLHMPILVPRTDHVLPCSWNCSHTQLQWAFSARGVFSSNCLMKKMVRIMPLVTYRCVHSAVASY